MKKTNIDKYAKQIIALLVFVEGYTVMGLELAWSKMLYPVFGDSVVTWTITFSIVMAGLALGYFSGQSAIVKKRSFKVLTACILLVNGMFLWLPAIVEKLYEVFYVSSFEMGAFLISLCVVMPVFVLLGMLPSAAIYLLQQSTNKKEGELAGLVFGISTLAGIFSCFFNVFAIMENFGVRMVVYSCSFMLLAALVVWMVYARSTAFKVAIAGIVMLSYAAHYLTNSTATSTSSYKVLAYSEGQLGQLMVANHYVQGSDSMRYLYLNRMPQSSLNLRTGESEFGYIQYIKEIVSSRYAQRSDILLLGLGGGTLLNSLKDINYGSLTVCEYDKRIVEASSKYFVNEQSVKNKAVEYVVSDARYYLKTSPKKYDLVIFDVFKGEVPPSHVFTTESLTETQNILNANGGILVNFIGNIEGGRGKAVRSIVKTLILNKWNVMVFQVPGVDNVIVWASPYSWDGKLINKFTRFTYPLHKINLSSDYVLTDDKPLIEFINNDSKQFSRGWFYERHTKKMLKEGIPLFY